MAAGVHGRQGGANVYDAGEGPKPRQGQGVRFGDRLFALDCHLGRWELASLDSLEPVGWVDADDVIERTWQPLTVGEAKERQIVSGTSNRTVDTVKESERLSVRVITQPGSKVPFARRPGEGDRAKAERVGSWRWYYLFDVELDEEENPWYLVGDIPVMTDKDDVVATNIRAGGSSQGLRGWVPGNKMTVWTTNLVLELNTANGAVAWRQDGNAPAVVFDVPHIQSEASFEEPLDQYWGEGGQMHPYRDPVGVPARRTRHMLIANHGTYFEVASAAAKDGAAMEDVRTETRQRLEKAIQEMKAIDIVFVVDRSGSMHDAIKETTKLLYEWARGIRAHRLGGGSKIRVPELDMGERKFEITTDLDVRMSIILFERTTEVILPPTDIVTKWRDVKRALDRLENLLWGGTEFVHRAVMRGLSPGVLETKLGRPADGAAHRRKRGPQRRSVGHGVDRTGTGCDARPEQHQRAGEGAEDGEGVQEQVERGTQEGPYDHPRRVPRAPRTLSRISRGMWADSQQWKMSCCSVATRRARTLRPRLVGHLEKKKARVESRLDYVAGMLAGVRTKEDAHAWSTAEGLTRVGLWAALERNDLTEQQVGDLGEVVYYHGYVPVEKVLQRPPDVEDRQRSADEEGTTTKSDESHFRVRVMLHRKEAEGLKRTAKALAEALEQGINEVCGNVEQDVEACEQNTKLTPKQAMLRAYATAALAVRGHKAEPDAIEEEIVRIEERALEGDTGYKIFISGTPNLGEHLRRGPSGSGRWLARADGRRGAEQGHPVA